MELEDVDERIEWEVRRVAAALGVDKWEIKKSAKMWHMKATTDTGIIVLWRVLPADVAWSDIYIGREVMQGAMCEVWRRSDGASDAWKYVSNAHPDYAEQMARGLYCLGVDSAEVLEELECPLSAHEKLELRLGFPREFWPQKWFDEEVRVL